MPADAILKLLSNVELKDVNSGWLITTGPLSKDAKGIVNEWKIEVNSKRRKLAYFTKDRIIQLLIDSNEIINPEKLECDISTLQLSDEILDAYQSKIPHKKTAEKRKHLSTKKNPAPQQGSFYFLLQNPPKKAIIFL